MGSAVKMRTDYSEAELRRLAKSSRDSKQSRRLLSLAAVLDGMSREDAARVGGMGRQTLRDWVHRFNEAGPDGLRDVCTHPVPPVPSGASPEAYGCLVWRSRAAAVTGPKGRTGRDRGSRSRPGCPWSSSLAADRSAESHQGSLRRRLSRTLCWQTAEGDRLLAHERASTSSGPGRRDRRGL